MNETNAITRISTTTTTSSVVPLPVSTTTTTTTQIHINPKQKQWNKAISTSIRSRLSKLCREGQPHLARHLLETLPRPSTVVWNSVIIGFICNNMPHEALLLYAQMKSTPNTRFDPYTFSSTLKACALTNDLVTGKAIHSHFLRSHSISNENPGPSRIVYNSLLNMYSSCQHDYVLKVFGVMRKRNVVAWNTLISWCNLVDTSFKVFDKMLERDVVSWNTIISAFVQNGFNDKALMLVCEMQKQRFLIDSVTATALLSAASNLRNLYIGRQTHAYLIRHGIQFEGMEGYLIDMYAKSGSIRSSELLFEHNCLSSKDQATWNTMIAGYTQNGLNEKGIFLLKEMLVQKSEVLVALW
ncbi:hypothetical protein TSUD_254910 [Trifolium subterraneum]|uniref:Pentatricopeptide repeat-containing protein n=1 Tax=Trifolium subterraneum TaxID=3900 RepID=A0A2Z6MND5_TRISU|nr:hypothetical protein TSUD_254910 [Trifolium subterraneum]